MLVSRRNKERLADYLFVLALFLILLFTTNPGDRTSTAPNQQSMAIHTYQLNSSAHVWAKENLK